MSKKLKSVYFESLSGRSFQFQQPTRLDKVPLCYLVMKKIRTGHLKISLFDIKLFLAEGLLMCYHLNMQSKKIIQMNVYVKHKQTEIQKTNL